MTGTEHPDWCVRLYCTANQGRTGAHRSKPVVLDGAKLSANLYATAAVSDVTYVEIHADVLLAARHAYDLGHVLTSLSKAARKATAEPSGGSGNGRRPA